MQGEEPHGTYDVHTRGYVGQSTGPVPCLGPTVRAPTRWPIPETE